MNYSPAKIIKEYLIDEGIVVDPEGSVDGWKIYLSNLPDGENTDYDAVACMDTSPVKDGRIMKTGETIFHHGIQLLVRTSEYNDGYAKASEILEALQVVDDVEITVGTDDFKINNVSPATGIVALGQEKGTKWREMFSLNFLVTLKEES